MPRSPLRVPCAVKQSTTAGLQFCGDLHDFPMSPHCSRRARLIPHPVRLRSPGGCARDSNSTITAGTGRIRAGCCNAARRQQWRDSRQRNRWCAALADFQRPARYRSNLASAAHDHHGRCVEAKGAAWYMALSDTFPASSETPSCTGNGQHQRRLSRSSTVTAACGQRLIRQGSGVRRQAATLISCRPRWSHSMRSYCGNFPGRGHRTNYRSFRRHKSQW